MMIRLTLSLSFSAEIEKIQKDEDKEDEKFIDVVINKNMKLGQKILIPVKQFPKVSILYHI